MFVSFLFMFARFLLGFGSLNCWFFLLFFAPPLEFIPRVGVGFCVNTKWFGIALGQGLERVDWFRIDEWVSDG